MGEPRDSVILQHASSIARLSKPCSLLIAGPSAPVSGTALVSEKKKSIKHKKEKKTEKKEEKKEKKKEEKKKKENKKRSRSAPQTGVLDSHGINNRHGSQSLQVGTAHAAS